MGFVYERKISTEEAKDKFIFILKNALKRFPQTDKTFTLQIGDKKYSTKIKPVSCSCVGTLHEHYHLLVDRIPEFSSLKKGDIATIKKLSDDIYSVSVKSKI